MTADPPRAAQRFEQRRSDRVRAGAAQARRGNALHGRHRNAAGTAAACRSRRSPPHGLPGDHGRPRQDAASEDPRRPARTSRRRRRRDAPARHRADRPAGRQSLSVRCDDREAGLHLRGRDREHRHRRSRDGARRGEESRSRRGDRRSARLLRSAGRARAQRRRALRGDAQTSRREGIRAHGQLRLRGRELSRARQRRRGRVSAIAGVELPASAWTCATARIRIRRRRSIAVAGCAGRQHRLARSSCRASTLSYNNIADGDTAFECVRQFADPACVIVKHANPCGVAVASDTLAAYDRAYKTDPTSAFGGIIAFNRAAHRRHRARDRRTPVRRADHRAGGRCRRARDVRAQGERARAGHRRSRAEQHASRIPQRQRRPARADAR